MNYIKIDNRETDLFSLLQKMIGSNTVYATLTIESVPLDIGDISFFVNGIEIAIIERKTLRDLAASIKDGRYEEQSYRLGGYPIHNHNISYLIEGDLTKWSNSSITKNTMYSALTSIQYIKGFSVIRTISLEDTALYVCNAFIKLCKTMTTGKKPMYYSLNVTAQEETDKDKDKDKDNEKDNYCSVIKKTKKDNITPENMGEIMLSQIPGISSVTACAIMARYVSIPELINALKDNHRVLLDITYANGKGQKRKINKSSGDTIIKFLSIEYIFDLL